jgi:hypothetical protein
MLNSEQNPEECPSLSQDKLATEADSSTTARFKIKNTVAPMVILPTAHR